MSKIPKNLHALAPTGAFSAYIRSPGSNIFASRNRLQSLGRPQFATDSDGAIVWDMGEGVTPFGQGVNFAGAFAQRLMFPGQYADSETGEEITLSHNWHRTYDPTLGRYLQSDPIGLAGGLNRYVYGLGDPVSNIDPTGELVPLAIMAGGFLFGAGLDLGLQLLQNGGNINCLDLKKAFFSGLFSITPVGRLAYVLGAKAIPWIARGAKDAYNLRKKWKKDWRLGLDGVIEKFRPSKPYNQISDPLASAGKTNMWYNGVAIGGGGWNAGKSIITPTEEDCPCK